MQTVTSSRVFAKYNILVLALSFAVLLATILFIIRMTDDYKDGYVFIKNALHWQSRTKGIVALPGNHMTLFKKLAQKSFMDQNDVNTLILGSSTVMGIRQEMFPKDWTVYNFAKTRQILSETIGEAYYFIEQYENLQWVIISLDYSIGNTLGRRNVKRYRSVETKKQTDFFDKLSDAITLNRLKIILRNVWSNLIRGNNEEYLCPENDGSGKDFGAVLAPGECWGYRYDGSATFKYHKVSKAEWRNQLNEEGLARDISNIEKFAGKVDRTQLNHLKVINDLLNRRSGGLILVSPPLIPGAQKMISTSVAGKYLQKYHQKLSHWVSVNNIWHIDAGESEKYGCAFDDFYNSHHALDRCYFKIFDQFFKGNRGVL